MLKAVWSNAQSLGAPRQAIRSLGSFVRPVGGVQVSQAPFSRYISLTTSGRQSEPQEDNSKIKQYNEIPGPRSIPLLGITPDLLKVSPHKMIQLFAKMPEKYGKLFKIKAAPGLAEFVCVFDPEDAKQVFRSEGKFPVRTPLDVWEESRLKHGKPLGMFFLKGPEWQRHRAPISKFMSVPRKVAEYHESFNEVTSDLLSSIRRKRGSDNMLTDVASELQHWAFEAVNVFILGKRLGCLDEVIPPDCQEFIDQMHRFFTASHNLLFGLPLYKIYPTKDYKDLMGSFEKIFEISMAHIEEKLKEIEGEDFDRDQDGPPLGMDFLTYMSKVDGMPLEMITTNAIDLMGAGVDTTSTTLMWTVYCLATSPEIQEKARQEVISAVGGAKVVTPAHIQHMPYTKSCIKEAMRLYAVAPNNTRILDNDIVLSGYRIPAGTSILIPTVAAAAQEYNFPNADQYIPDRWSRDNSDPPDPFASLPFGFGARMCVGRRLAELELHIGTAHLLSNFTLEFRDPQPMDYSQDLFLVPDRRMDIAFIDRS